MATDGAVSLPPVYHLPIMCSEVITDLAPQADGIYVDGTAGGGGHSFAIARKLTGSGKLFALDRDPDAVAEAGRRLAGLPAEVIRANFTEMGRILAERGLRADGILLDLGVSSHELDEDTRGFSFHRDGPLDMRMEQQGTTAADLVNTLSQSALADILFRYGEEKFANSIAARICAAREQAPIETTLQLAEIVRSGVPQRVRREKNPCRKTFQALRIAVNREMECLEEVLKTAFSVLRPGGRLVILTFHSLEDRAVKQAFAEFCAGCTCPPQFPVCVCGKKPRARLLHRKPLTATEQELQENPRSRSAKLRSLEKIAD